jgi:hypothetical protein
MHTKTQQFRKSAGRVPSWLVTRIYRYNDRRNKAIRWRGNDVLGYDEYAVRCTGTERK